ncbi:MAG: flagellar basal body P-ring protein FlgI [Planctomycetes bacterium]|nr:flagellar basal body P-ring protein FlgI [Planctomycetota bacterium]
MFRKLRFPFAAFIVLSYALPAGAAQIRDVVIVRGVRSQQVIGYGLVVGLKGTGDKSKATQDALNRFFVRAGMTMKAGDTNPRNVALVLVTAEIPPFAQEGQRIDVTVNAVNDATSIAGGRLVVTPLHGPDPSIVFARAQGTISFMGRQEPVHTTSGIVRDGAIIERTMHSSFVSASGVVELGLKQASSALAHEIAQTINLGLRAGPGEEAAVTVSPGLVRVAIPASFSGSPVDFLSEILRYPVDVDLPARVVINEDTGAVAVNDTVRVGSAAVAVGNIFIVVGTPGNGTSDLPAPDVVPVQEGTSLQELVQALQQLRITPRDLIAVIEQLVSVGALSAEIVME